MDSEQPIHINTSACCSAGDGEDTDEMKEMLGITAWKHAPIIPLPNYHALILHAHPIFFLIQTAPY